MFLYYLKPVNEYGTVNTVICFYVRKSLSENLTKFSAMLNIFVRFVTFTKEKPMLIDKRCYFWCILSYAIFSTVYPFSE